MWSAAGCAENAQDMVPVEEMRRESEPESEPELESVNTEGSKKTQILTNKETNNADQTSTTKETNNARKR